MNGARPLWIILAPAIFLVLWSGGFTVAKIGLRHAEPMTILALRYGLVLALLLPLIAVLKPAFPATFRGWVDVAIVGLLIQVGYFGLCYVAFKADVSSAGVAIITGLQPILVALLAPRFVGEHVGVRAWIGLVLGVAGAIVVILSQGSFEAGGPGGILAAIGALVGIAGGTLYEKRFGLNHHPVTSNFIQYVAAFAVILPIALAGEGMQVAWNIEFSLVMAYLVIANSLLAMTLLLAMIRVGEVSRVSALFFLVPAVAGLIAWPMLGESMPPVSWLGLALAATGVFLVSRKTG